MKEPRKRGQRVPIGERETEVFCFDYVNLLFLQTKDYCFIDKNNEKSQKSIFEQSFFSELS